MKKTTVCLMITLMLLTALVSVPTLNAQTAERDDLPPQDYIRDISKVNDSVINGVDYYINIKRPTSFAVSGKNIAVVDGDDVKLFGNSIDYVYKGEKYYKDTLYELSSMTMSDNFLFLLYYTESFTRQLVIHRYNANIESDVKKTYTVREFLSATNITATENQITNIESRVTNMSFANEKLYLTISLGDIYELTPGQPIRSVGSAEEPEPIMNAKYFTVDRNGNIYAYCAGNENALFVKTFDGDSFTRHTLNIPSGEIKAMETSGDFLYVLTPNSIIAFSHSDYSSQNYTFSLDKESVSFKRYFSGGEHYISFTTVDNDNIFTYKESIVNGNATLEFVNHYGSNCTCQTPHKGFMNSPSAVAANNDGSIIYVADNSGNRLIAVKNGKDYFYSKETLGVSNISAIKTDKNNILYIASGSTVAVIADNSKHGDSDAPFSKISQFTGFDGNVSDIAVTSSGVLYAVTDKGVLYSLKSSDVAPKKLLTLTYEAKKLFVSESSSKLYISSQNEIYSYDLNSASDENKRITVDAYGIADFIVDYAGNIYVMESSDNSRLLRYTRNKTGYSLERRFNSANNWERVLDTFLGADGKIYFADANTHLVEKTAGLRFLGFSTEKDSAYEHPKNFDSAPKVGAVTTNAVIYLRPDNYEITTDIAFGEYVLVLADDAKYKDMSYVVRSDGSIGYIEKTFIREVPKSDDSILGKNVTPLYSSATVYKYPFESADKIDTVKKGTSMTLIDNVGYENNTHVWQREDLKWYRVSYVSNVGVSMTGYVKLSDLAPNITIEAPSTKLFLRVTTAIGETATMYALPDLGSGIIEKYIKNGSLVELMQPEFDKDSKFTRVKFVTESGEEKIGYMLTANLQPNAFTAGQIIAIILVTLAIIITVTVIILLIRYKKIKEKRKA